MTIEEIIAAMGTNPALLNSVLSHVIQTPEGQEVLANHAKTEIAKVTSETYNGIDQNINEILGQQKPANMKTYDWVKKLATDLKELQAKTPGDQTELQKELTKVQAELATALETNKGAGDWHQKYLAALKEWETKSAEYIEKIQGLEGNTLETLVTTDLTTGRAGLKFLPGLPDETVNEIVATKLEKIKKNAKIEDGKPVYYKDDGTPWLNGLYKPITAKEIFESELKSILHTNPGGGGADKTPGKTRADGSKIVTDGTGDNAKKRIELDRTQFTTKLGFANHIEKELIAEGITKNSTEWHQLIQTARSEYDVDKLERV